MKYFLVFILVLGPIYMTFFSDYPISRSTGANAAFLIFSLILVICTVCLSFLYNLLLMILGIFFGLITSGFAGILIGIMLAFQRFVRDVTWAGTFFENSYNHNSILWNILFFIGIIVNCLAIYLFEKLVMHDRKS